MRMRAESTLFSIVALGLEKDLFPCFYANTRMHTSNKATYIYCAYTDMHKNT